MNQFSTAAERQPDKRGAKQRRVVVLRRFAVGLLLYSLLCLSVEGLIRRHHGVSEVPSSQVDLSDQEALRTLTAYNNARHSMEVSPAYEAYLGSALLLGVVSGLVLSVFLFRRGWRVVMDTPLFGTKIGILLAVLGLGIGFFSFVGPVFLARWLFDQNLFMP